MSERLRSRVSSAKLSPPQTVLRPLGQASPQASSRPLFAARHSEKARACVRGRGSRFPALVPPSRSPQDAPDLRAGIGETHGSEMTPDLGTRWHLLEVVPGPGTGLLGAGAASGTAPKCRWNPGPRRTGAGLHRAPLDGRVGPPPGPESPQMQRQGSPVPLLPPQCPPRGQGPQPGEVPRMPTRPRAHQGLPQSCKSGVGASPPGLRGLARDRLGSCQATFSLPFPETPVSSATGTVTAQEVTLAFL